jgi:hypothetical protein
MKRYIPQQVLKILYNTLILPHLTYGLLTWGHQSNQIFKLQKKAVRILTLSRYNAHSEPLFKKLGLLKIHDIYKQQELKFYFKYEQKKLPIYFNNISLIHFTDQHDHYTRGNNDLVTPRLRYNTSKCSVMKRLPSVVNNCPANILEKIHSHSFKGYSDYIKIVMLNGYKYICEEPNCYICRNS